MEKKCFITLPLDDSCGTVVQQWTHHLKFKGLSPTNVAGTWRENAINLLVTPGNPYWREILITVDLLVLISLDLLLFDTANLIFFLIKQAN
jgi:hypothetical protein